MPKKDVKTQEKTAKSGRVQPIVSLRLLDKNNTPIKEGDKVLIENKRKDISKQGVVCLLEGDDRLRIKYADGKYDSVHTWLDAIWWRNDIPENFIKVLAR